MRLVKRFFPLFLIVLLACSLLALNFTPTNKLTVKAATLFSDGFESGNFSAWTGTSTNQGGQPTVQSTTKHHGSYAMQATLTQTGFYAHAYKDVASGNTFYARAYVRFNKIPVSGESYDEIISMYRISDGYGGLIIRIVSDGAGGAKFRAFNNYYGTIVDGSAAVVDTWYCVETLNLQSGTLRWWIDGVEQSTVGNGAVPMDRFRVGFTHNGGSNATTMQIDCCVVADAYIGPEAAGTNYNIDLSMATAITYTLTSQWQTKNTLTIQTPETYTTTQQWNTKTTLTLPTPLSWTTTSQTAYNLALPFTQSFTWLLHLSVTHTGVLYAVDLLWSTPQTWTMQAWTGLSYILDLAWTSGFTWTIDFLNVPLAALDVLGVAAFALIIGLTALGVAALVMLKRKDAD
jgi:hypothetical protein